jgi:hypothetical protein
MFKAIKYFFIFLYHFFFIDQTNGHQSNTKFFANAGYICWLWLFPWTVIHGSTAPMELWLVFGAVVIGNRSLNVWMQGKSGQPCDGDGSWKQMMNGPDGSDASATTTTTTTAVVTPAPTPATPAPAPTVVATTTTTSGPVVPNSADLVS